MNNKTIAFLFNIAPSGPRDNDFSSQIGVDGDSQGIVKAMISHFKFLGYSVIPIEADERAYFKLYQYKKQIDLVFNYSVGLFGACRTSHLTALLEMLQLPHTGPSILAQAVIFNKVKAKDTLQNYKIPTLPYFVFKKEDEVDDLTDLQYPLFVKPVAQGSSIGITPDSIVWSKKQLKRQVKLIVNNFNQAAMIEDYLFGREFTVALLGNPLKILPILEINHQVIPKKYGGFNSLLVKSEFESKNINHLICPAKCNKQLEKKIIKICKKIIKHFDLADVARVDIRCDKNGNPYVLEINSPPGLTPPEISPAGYVRICAQKSGISYDDLLNEIIKSAFKRYKYA